MSKRCFVISPIGEPGSAMREHADDALEFIIKPAMEELGIYAYRADHSQQIGRITDQMYTSILSDDLCIAVLTFHNPNVFDELAIAQSAARPVIILIEKGQTIPFDIRDLRAIEYDLKPRALRDKVYVNQIVEHVRNLEAAKWTVNVPFGSQLSPLGGSHGQLKFYDKVESYGTSDRWMELVQNTSAGLDLSGISLRWWTKLAAFRSTLLLKAGQGCKVRILLMHPDNPALPQYINKSIKIGGLQHLPTEINGTYSFFGELSKDQPNIQVRRVLTGCLHQQIVRNDDIMTIMLLLYAEGTSQSPMVECSSRSPLYKAVIAFPSVRPQLFSATLINFRRQTRSIAMQRTAGLLLVSIVLVSYASLATRLSN